MCGRYALRANVEEIARVLGLAEPPADAAAREVFDRPRFNVAPTQVMPVCRRNEDGARVLVGMRFGLVPFWADSLKVGARMINARSETVAEKPAFRAAFRRRRCLVPADAWFEWQRNRGADGKAAKSAWLLDRHGEPFCLAGLHEFWRPADGVAVESFTILTTAAEGLAAEVHDRMPVYLPPSMQADWLGETDADPTKVLSTALGRSDAGARRITPVSSEVNNVRNDGPRCVEPIGEARVAEAGD